MDFIRLENIDKTYRLGEVEVPVLRNVSLTIGRGEMVALMGASGSGKTTLMNILGCLDRPTAGRYWLDGVDVSGLSPNERAIVRTSKLGFVFQNFSLLPRTTAVNNVLMPLDYSVKAPPSRVGMARTIGLLERVGLKERLHHVPSQMSGGQQQRVAIARSLVNLPLLLLADEPTGNLDSRTSAEILRMFQQLNAEGITVVLVTHDSQVADYAHRTIRIVDGAVEDDTSEQAIVDQRHAEIGTHIGFWQPPPAGDEGCAAVGDRHGEIVAAKVLQRTAATGAVATADPRSPSSSQPGSTAERPPAVISDEAVVSTRRHLASALIPATWRTALGALRRNKMRSGLSALGVIIAVAAVIAMTEIGQGSNALLQKGIASMGANTVMIFAGTATTGGVNRGTGSALTLTPEDADEVTRQCPAVTAVAPIVRARSQIVYGNRNCVPEQISGTTPAFLEVRDWGIAVGNMFSDRDVRNSNKVCVIGHTVKRTLFGSVSPIGKEVRINNVSFRIIGVLSPKGANMMGMDQDNVVLAPWTTIKYRVSGTSLTNTNQSASTSGGSSSTRDSVNTLNNLYPSATSWYLERSTSQTANYPQPVRFTNVDQVIAKAGSETKIQPAIRQIGQLLRERHRIRPGAEDDFTIRDMAEITNILSSTTRSMSLLLLVVALISLVVGGVGIMNIMLVSVTERTQEIGLRMAVGARSHHILRQFLVEAVVLSLVGGAIGILVGRAVSIAVWMTLRWPVQASIPAIIAAFAVSATIGIAFGFYPAWKASRLDPIDALRYE